MESFDQDPKAEEREISHFFDGFSKIQPQNLESSSMFFGKTGFGFNSSDNQSLVEAPDTISQQPTERKSTRQLENYQLFRSMNSKSNDAPFS